MTKKREALESPENHTERLHSEFGPSAMERILNCPGSVRAQRGWPDRPTSYAQHGTAAHMLCELVVENIGEVDPRDYAGGVVDLNQGTISKESDANPSPDDLYVFEIDDEMIDAVEMYRDTLMEWIEVGVDEFDAEVRLDLTHIKAGAFGTSDALIYKPRTQHLIVGDFKFGRGHAVEVADNPQLMTYAVGALRRLHNRGVKRLTLLVVQPRAYHHDGPVRVYEVDVFDLDMFEDTLRDGAAATDDPNAPLVAGDWCFFCKNIGCQTLERAVVDALSLDWAAWKAKGEGALREVTKMTSAELGKAIRNAGIINGYFRRIEKFAHDEALSGNVPDGTKIVEKQGRRKWIDSDVVVDKLTEAGFDESDIYAERKVKTPSALEKAVGKKQAKALGLFELAHSVSSGKTLTVIEDPRPSFSPATGDEFGEVDL